MTKTYLVHHGIKGQRWGVRRFQNEDGTLTPTGEKRYGTAENMTRVTSRNRKIMVGAGVAAATVGAALLINRNRKLKKELSIHKGKEAARLANLAKGRAKRMANIAAGIKPPPKFKVPPNSDVLVRSVNKKGQNFVLEMLSVGGGYIIKGGG